MSDFAPARPSEERTQEGASFAAARGHALYARASQPDESRLVALHAHRIDRAARLLCARAGLPHAFDDLWSAGALGLLDAARRFDPARDVRFETFAEHRIRGAMLDELRRLDHLPRRLRADLDRLRAARESLAATLGREPDDTELAKALDLPVEEVIEQAALLLPSVPIDEAELPPSPAAPPEERIDRERVAGRLAAAIAALPERQQLVVSLRYVEGLSNKEIASILDVSEPRVCQIHGDAMKRLRAALADAA